jgi:uncharacterized protein YjbI with pentapeptide repeats
LNEANLKRASLEGASLQQASLHEATLTGAELSGAKLGGADLTRVDLSGAELLEAEAEGAVFSFALLVNARLSGAKLDRANFADADLADSDLGNAVLSDACFQAASLIRANLEEANLSRADLRGADLRHAVLSRVTLFETKLDGAKLGQAVLEAVNKKSVIATSIDTSEHGDGSLRLEGDRIALYLGGRLDSSAPATRYFGRGDVLRDARLEFGANSRIHIDSRFENCSIELGDGAELTIGEPGVLKDCQINGSGNVTIHGRFFERASPGIVGVRRLVVSSKGAVVGAIEQGGSETVFAFQPGCRLRVKIAQRSLDQAAE